jgi:hypothetical protein
MKKLFIAFHSYSYPGFLTMDFQDEASCPVKICQVRQTQDAAIDPAQTVRHVVQPMCFIGCGFCFFKRLPRAVRVVMHSINTHFDKPNANQPGQLQAVYTCLYSLYMSIHVYTCLYHHRRKFRSQTSDNMDR